MSESETTGTFGARHIGPDEPERRTMLAAVGFDSLDALVDAAVPSGIRDAGALDLTPPRSEAEATAELRALAARNTVCTSLIGLGYYGTVTPPVIRRNVLENPAWYTAYTPYQPEISQGRLEALVNFQTMVADLAGLDLANASLLDEATAAAEAMTLLHRANPNAGSVFLVDSDALPQTIDVVRTRAEPLGLEVIVGDVAEELARNAGVFGVLLQYPGASGALTDVRSLIETAAARGARVVVASDLLALTLVTPPGELGADVVVGSAQRFGVPMMYGGPHAGFMAVRSAVQRQLPGRLVGVSVDAPAVPRTGSRCRRANSTSAVRRPRATSAPRRCYWPWLQACMPRITGPTVLWRSRAACTALRRCSPRPWPTSGSRSCTSTSSTRSRCARPARPSRS